MMPLPHLPPPQHEYDLVGATWLGQWMFASVADEKVAYIFEALECL